MTRFPFIRPNSWVRLLMISACLLILAGCQPTYSKDKLSEIIPREIQEDFSIQIDDMRFIDGHLGIVFKTENLWTEEGQLTEAVKDEIANTSRTIERVLASSDAEVEKISVMVASPNSTLNVYFERDYEEIRKKRVDAVAWQNVINTDVYDTVPAWRWEAFSEDYYYYTEQDPALLAEQLQQTLQVKSNLEIGVKISGSTLGILTRIAKMQDGEALTPEADTRLSALLSEAGLLAMKSAYPINTVTVTLMGSDVDYNVYRTDSSDNFRARVLEEIDQATHIARIVEGKTPFWEWQGFGIISLYTDEKMLSLIQQEGGTRLDLTPALSLQGDRLNVLFSLPSPQLPAMESYQADDRILKFLGRAERILLLGVTKPAMLQVSFLSTSGTAGCLERSMNDAINYYLGAVSSEDYQQQLTIRTGEDCLPTPKELTP